MDKELNDDLNNVDWGFNGTNEFQFYDTAVTSVVYQDGTSSSTDSIVGCSIVDNLNRPFAKLTDLDTDIQDHSTIYGMNFGLSWDCNGSQETSFYGKWTANVIAQSMWPRLKCYDRSNHGDELFQDSFPLGGQSTTRITDVDWNNLGNSQALNELRSAANGGDLMVRLSIFYYTRNYPPYIALNATLGYVVGVIGVPGPRDTLNVPGQRVLEFTNFPVGLKFNQGDLCEGYEDNIAQFGPWMYTAPFEVDTTQSVIHLDTSNSISSDLGNSLRNIGVLRIGILRDGCVQILGEEDIPYDDSKALAVNSGIHDIPVHASLLDDLADHPLVLGQYLSNSSDTGTPLCGEFLTVDEESHSMNIILQESEYFIRPNGYYVDRLDRLEKPSTTMTLYATRFGEPVEIGVRVQSAGNFLPPDGVIVTSSTATTDSNGIVTFQFQLQEDVPIPANRAYGEPQCTWSPDPSDQLELPIDGQVYNFTYCIDTGDTGDCKTDISLAFLAFSDFEYVKDPTWVDDVQPILAQFARLTAIMNTILDMSSYEDVTKSHNIDMMKKTMMLHFENPSYMPTTRDLSPAKRNMILEWLDNPKYDTSGVVPVETPVCKTPKFSPQTRPLPRDKPLMLARCSGQSLRFNDHPKKLDHPLGRLNFPPAKFMHFVPKDRPLLRFGFRHRTESSDSEPVGNCTLDTLQAQLQTAIQLEWSTLPTYLTTMYSIVDGCNREIYDLIRGVIMQEMLHFTQAANILIAVNGSPLIDDASVTASYPTHLPGDVLPRLIVSIEKLSLEHVHDIFMGIELPQETDVAGEIDNELYTIGAFYKEISDCIEDLGDEIFNSETLSRQVQWPWNAEEDVGIVYPITNALSAKNAIDSIIAQGEGAGLLNPVDIENNTLAHFFLFEEIVCQRHLRKESEDTYSYTGEPIPFNSEGVWPMRSDPKVSDVLPDTNCFTESRVFHQAYRNLLRKLQAVFNGQPDEIFDAVSIMESLQVHAKRLMWTKFNPNDPQDRTTCGPVWDYDWPQN